MSRKMCCEQSTSKVGEGPPRRVLLAHNGRVYTEICSSYFVYRDAKIASSEHMRIGGSEEMAWLQICEPTEKDKGKYTFEISDGKDNHQRSLDLSAEGEASLLPFLRDLLFLIYSEW